MSGHRNKRRQLVVDANMQVGLSLRLVGWLYIYVVIFAVVVNVPAIYEVAFGDAAGRDYTDAVEQLRSFTTFTALPLILTFIVMAVHGIAFTHRIAGPVYRFKETLKQIRARTAPTAIQLRDKDYMKDLAEEFNATLASLREESARQRRMNNEALDGARRMVEAAERGDIEPLALAALAHTVLDSVERLDLHLGETPPEAATPIPLPQVEIEIPEPVGS